MSATRQPAIQRGSGRETLRGLARAGLIARGAVYGVIGILALKLALGSHGKTESQTGALATIAHQTFGQVILVALGLGLGAYALWRLIDGLTGSGSGAQHRISALASAVAYGGLCYTAGTIIAGGHRSSGSPKPAAAGVLGWPGGPVLVAIAGLVVIAVGVAQGHKGVTRRFLKDARTEEMRPLTRRGYTALGVIGHLARAVTFLLIGYGLVKAALDYSAKSAVGLDGALQKLEHASDGPLLLGIVAAGFIAFALYSIADSRYHRI